ncbi:MAG: glycosyltransferase [Methylococcales bacterium]|nr:glycosyltransferase [Methylococcales bacterium]
MTSQPIKILHIVPEDHPPFVELCNHYLGYFSNPRFESTVLYLTGFETEETKQQTNAKDIIFWELTDNSSKLTLSNIKRFYQLIKNKKYDRVVCHSHDALMMACIVNIANPVFKIMGISYKTAEFSSKFMQLFLYACKARVCLLGALKSVQFDIRRHVKVLPKESIEMSHYSLDYKKAINEILSKTEAINKLKLEQGSYVFGVSHESGSEKDISTILKAFSNTRKEIKQAVLVIFCEHNQYKFIKQQTKNLLIENAVVLKNDPKKFTHYLRAFKSVIVTRNSKIMDVDLLKIMISGLPVIAAKMPANIEYIGKNGYLYNVIDADQLTYFMSFVYQLTAEERTAVKKKMLAHVNGNFTHSVNSKKFHALPMVNKFLYEKVREDLVLKTRNLCSGVLSKKVLQKVS